MRDGTGTPRSALGLALRLALLLTPPCLLGLALGCASLPSASFRGQQEDEDKELKEVRTIGDVTDVGNVNPVPVSGVGLVVGLAGTGGAAPPGDFRNLLMDELRKQKVPDPKAVVDAPDNSLVLISGTIPAGTRKGDPLDIEVYLPQGGKASSLRGGTLLACALEEFDNTRHLNPNTTKGDHLLRGHVVGRAQGAVLTNFGRSGDDDLRKGHIWEGGVSLIDRPFLLMLKNDQKFARVAGAVAARINAQFQDDPQHELKLLQHRRLLVLNEVTDQINDTFHSGPVRSPIPGKSETARPFSKEAVLVRVPWEYRLNPERYLRVVRLVPLQESQEERSQYRQKLQAMLLDPARTVRGALRLEALGQASIPALKVGLHNDNPLVRFCAAEALTYLGNSAGTDELAKLARRYEQLRAYCLMALASLDEPACHERLADLLEAPAPELRYGAFRALRLLDESDPHVAGKLVNQSFWVHTVEPQSPPLVHFTLGQRAEVVLFGSAHHLQPPFALRAQEFTIRADAADDRCMVRRFMVREGRIDQQLCALDLEDVLRAMADLGALYPDVVELLRELDEAKALSCPVCMNALPPELSTEDLAALGRNADAWGTGANAATGP